ncbi:hypothetical protein TNCV_169561 [Trichonephila clavipes]|nr:hypothetical protein TNCV_169561 [Trichonephila clavipes]
MKSGVEEGATRMRGYMSKYSNPCSHPSLSSAECSAAVHEFQLGHSVSATVANVKNAWGTGSRSERTDCILFAKSHSGNMENDHKPGNGRSVCCDVDCLWQKIEAQSASMVRQMGAEL